MPWRGTWMPDAKLRHLFEQGFEYEDIAEQNFRETGWQPNRSTVMRKLQGLGLPSRNGDHSNLIPWRVAKEHNDHRFRYMLQAESRKRLGLPLSDRDQRELSMLDHVLHGRGADMVIGYDRKLGWYLTDQTEADTDIIRRPERRDREDYWGESLDRGWRDEA